MPELPEVEVIRRGLQRHLPDRRVETVSHSGKLLRIPVDLEAMRTLLVGRKITEVTRRAKYLLIHTDSRALLIIHLGMTGRLGIFPLHTPLAKHDHLRWGLDSGFELRFQDTRRFGSAQVLSPKEAEQLEETFFNTTGPEPLGDACTPEYLHSQAQKKRQAIKTFLMDTRIIAGVGNIYANECLFKSGIHPERQVSTLKPDDWQRLLRDLRSTLNHAIDCGGSTIRDYLNAGGQEGYFQVHFKVYGKAGDPCERCGAPILKIRIGGRASYLCPDCQK